MFHNPQITLHANFEKGKRGTRVSLFGKRAAIKSGLKNEQRPFEKIKKKKKKVYLYGSSQRKKVH